MAVDKPVAIEMLSSVPLERLPGMHASTWLDRRIEGPAEPARDVGFGREVRAADVRRRQWLIEQDLAVERDGALRMASDAIDRLRRREVLRVADTLSAEMGKDFHEVGAGERLDGVLRRSVDMVSGRHALIERAHDFALVPWRPTLERQIGKPVTGIVREAGISWAVGRERGGPTIS